MVESMPSSVLVTGGAGFVGSSLALFLKKKFPKTRVTAMDNLHRRGSELNLPRLQAQGVEFHRGDIRSKDAFPAGPFEAILECSAEPSVLAGYDDATDYLFHTNLTGTYHCLEKARSWKSRVIFFSTSRVYPVEILESQPWVELETRFEWKDAGVPGISARGVGEDLPMAGFRSLYGFTKFASEALVEEYRAGFGVPAVVNRCGLISGPWQMGRAEQGIIAHWVFGHLWNRPLRYIGYGAAGKQVRDALHIDDLCLLVSEQLLEFSKWEGWLGNVSGGKENTFSLRELTGICREKLGKSVEIGSDSEDRPMDLRIFYADCSRLHGHSPWRPSRGVERIVVDLADWALENEAILRPMMG